MLLCARAGFGFGFGFGFGGEGPVVQYHNIHKDNNNIHKRTKNVRFPQLVLQSNKGKDEYFE